MVKLYTHELGCLDGLCSLYRTSNRRNASLQHVFTHSPMESLLVKGDFRRRYIIRLMPSFAIVCYIINTPVTL